MFLWRNKKNIMWIPHLIWNYAVISTGKTRIEQAPLDLEVIAGYDAKFTCSGSTDFDEAKNMVVGTSLYSIYSRMSMA